MDFNLKKIFLFYVLIFSTFSFIISCSKSQEESSFTGTTEFVSETVPGNLEDSSFSETGEPAGETEPEDSFTGNAALPFIIFGNRELSFTGTSTAEGTVHLLNWEESNLREYSVSCLFGYIDRAKGVKKT